MTTLTTQTHGLLVHKHCQGTSAAASIVKNVAGTFEKFLAA